MSELNDQTIQLLKACRKLEGPAAEALLNHLYAELKAVASRQLRGELPGHEWQTTDVVHETFLKLMDQAQINCTDRAHFLALAATAMRRLLVDHARHRNRAKRGGDRHRVDLLLNHIPAAGGDQKVDVVALDEGLDELARLNQRQAQIVEMRYFAGMTIDETAAALKVSPRTVKGDWRLARAWLKQYLNGA
ncbi:MAG TPA: sigma-70 family RNA polymerase sigma factor [Nitrospirales bacterium]|jgi:RNA polymerase sigma factor (TIGR02999 family)|nr:sigma-70 family RNA polymerase sigma factor [Nitrospirales bacterium]